MGDPAPYGRSIWIWESSQYDRPKREMLRAALRGISKDEATKRPKMVDDIEWILCEANKLEDMRNNAIHSPLLIITFDVAPSPVSIIRPNTFQMNKRAMKLENATKLGLVGEFRYCRDASNILYRFASDMWSARTTAHVPWPDRPSLPNRGAKKSRSPRKRRQT